MRRGLAHAGWLALVLLSWRCAWSYDLTRRQPQVVQDLPPYSEELRSQELNPPEPQGPQPGYSGAGYYLRWAPDQATLAVTTDPGGHYRTVNVWNPREGRLSAVISIEDADPGSGRAYRYGWSRDSKALFIYGSGSLSTGKTSSPVLVPKLCLVYLPERDQLYEVKPCDRTRWAY